MPSIILSLGIALEFRLIDEAIKQIGYTFDVVWINEAFQTTLGMFTSGLGAQLTWTLPFGLLIMFAVFNRFDKSLEEAARDLGASPFQTFCNIVLPIIGPSILGIALFGFTLSYETRNHTGYGLTNTLPLVKGLTPVTTPVIYALGTVDGCLVF